MFEFGTTPFSIAAGPGVRHLVGAGAVAAHAVGDRADGFAVAPLSVAKSYSVAPSFPVAVDSAVVMVALAHLDAWNGTGAMKSFNSLRSTRPGSTYGLVLGGV